MSSANTTPPSFPTLWRDTQAGKAEVWIREKVRQMRGRKTEQKKDRSN